MEGVFQIDLQVVAHVVATGLALTASATATATHEVAEHFLENIGEAAEPCAGSAAAEPGPAATGLFKGVMTEPVIGGAFLFVLQDLVGLVDFLELGFGVLVTLVLVRVILHRLLAVGAFQGRRIRVAVDAQNFVEIA